MSKEAHGETTPPDAGHAVTLGPVLAYAAPLAVAMPRASPSRGAWSAQSESAPPGEWSDGRSGVALVPAATVALAVVGRPVVFTTAHSPHSPRGAAAAANNGATDRHRTPWPARPVRVCVGGSTGASVLDVFQPTHVPPSPAFPVVCLCALLTAARASVRRARGGGWGRRYAAVRIARTPLMPAPRACSPQLLRLACSALCRPNWVSSKGWRKGVRGRSLRAQRARALRSCAQRTERLARPGAARAASRPPPSSSPGLASAHAFNATYAPIHGDIVCHVAADGTVAALGFNGGVLCDAGAAVAAVPIPVGDGQVTRLAVAYSPKSDAVRGGCVRAATAQAKAHTADAPCPPPSSSRSATSSSP